MSKVNTSKAVSPLLKLGILLFPLLFSWFTLKSGYTTKARIVSFSWLALIFLVVATGNETADTITGLIIIGAFLLLIFEFFHWLFKKANKRKEKMLSIINNDEEWSRYCIDKNLTPLAQKFVLKTYGITKAPVELPDKPSHSLFTVSLSSSPEDEDDEWKKYDSVEQWKNDLTVIWAGQTDDIEFSYRKDWNSPKERKKVTPQELVFDSNKRIYVKGLCHKRNEIVYFNQDKIETKILAGSTRYDFDEWVERRLKIDIYALNDNHKIWI